MAIDQEIKLNGSDEAQAAALEWYRELCELLKGADLNTAQGDRAYYTFQFLLHWVEADCSPVEYEFVPKRRQFDSKWSKHAEHAHRLIVMMVSSSRQCVEFLEVVS